MGDNAPILGIPETPPTPPTPPPVTVPLAALEAERSKRQSVEAKLAEIEAARQAADAAEALKRGEGQRLYEEAKVRADKLEADLKAATERLTAQEKREAERRDVRVKALPDDLRDLADGIDGDRLDALLDKLEARAKGQPAPPARTPLTPGRAAVEGGDPDALTADEEAWAKGRGYLGKASSAAIKRAYLKSNPPKK
jgi:hypothetical protein